MLLPLAVQLIQSPGLQQSVQAQGPSPAPAPRTQPKRQGSLRMHRKPRTRSSRSRRSPRLLTAAQPRCLRRHPRLTGRMEEM